MTLSWMSHPLHPAPKNEPLFAMLHSTDKATIQWSDRWERYMIIWCEDPNVTGTPTDRFHWLSEVD